MTSYAESQITEQHSHMYRTYKKFEIPYYIDCVYTGSHPSYKSMRQGFLSTTDLHVGKKLQIKKPALSVFSPSFIFSVIHLLASSHHPATGAKISTGRL